MKITPRSWMALTSGERMGILQAAVEKNKAKWTKS